MAADPWAEAGERIRIMSYNAHSCIGMDGRVSPRRVARVIQHYAPDIVAVQELEHGRSRSRGEDQAAALAELTGYHHIFCPTVMRGSERYGHAILSKWPLEVVKTGNLPSHAGNWWPEQRAAIWVRLRVGDRSVNVVSTHLGLSGRERMAQMQALMGEDWLGPVVDAEPVVLCGDFNFAPGGAAYRLAASRLRDVQLASTGTKPANTFSSLRPFTRLDHIFISTHFEVEKVRVPLTPITRVASDHLPLMADLLLDSCEGAEKTTRTAV